MLSKIGEFFVGLVARFRSESGQALAEYGLILALIAVVCMVALVAHRFGHCWVPGRHSHRSRRLGQLGRNEQQGRRGPAGQRKDL